jgi:hypothetical protein
MLAERAIVQVSDADLHMALDGAGAQGSTNSGHTDQTADATDNTIAIIMRHLSGNLRSRFQGFLTEDGEKPDRNRDAEFESQHARDRAAIMADWNDAWDIVLGELERMRPEDLERTIHIRQEPFAVVEALNRSIAHTAYHVGQIVFLAKHFAGPNWSSLSIPKGRSAEASHGMFKSSFIREPGAGAQK